MYEKISHPSHYNVPGKKECIEQMLEDYGAEITITFCLTNAYKYLYRMGYKINNPADDDLKKVRWYFNYARKCKNEYSVEMDEPMRKLYSDIEWDLSQKRTLTETQKGYEQ